MPPMPGHWFVVGRHEGLAWLDQPNGIAVVSLKGFLATSVLLPLFLACIYGSTVPEISNEIRGALFVGGLVFLGILVAIFLFKARFARL
jgi:hypothetical protein